MQKSTDETPTNPSDGSDQERDYELEQWPLIIGLVARRAEIETGDNEE